MPSPTRAFLTSSAFILAAPAAFADLTADDVWNDWQRYVTGFGYDISGQEVRSGDTLSIVGVSIVSEVSDVFGGASIRMDRIVMTEQADGTVDISFPAVTPMELSTTDPDGEMMRISMDYRQTGMAITASGAPDALRYDYRADDITLETTGVEVDGQLLPPSANVAEITLNDLSGQTESTTDSQRRYAQELQVASLRYVFKAQDAQSNTRSDVSGQIQSMRFTGTSVLPLRDVDPSDMDAMLASGFAADGTFDYAANAMTVMIDAPSGNSEASLISGSGTAAVTMGQKGLTYEISQTGLQAEVTSAEFPFPLNFNVANSSFNMSVPVLKSETPDDFALGFALDGFEMTEALWGLFDPAAQLPRDPATIALDLAGKARLLFNFFDPVDVAAIGPEDVPAEIEALDINSLRIAAAGAELTGDGAFTFDNSAGGAPKPTGAVDLTLIGANTLIDKLVATGLLPEEQAMGARMMMGLLAVPSDTPDTLNSKIEINAQGHVIANGQRIQ